MNATRHTPSNGELRGYRAGWHASKQVIEHDTGRDLDKAKSFYEKRGAGDTTLYDEGWNDFKEKHDWGYSLPIWYITWEDEKGVEKRSRVKTYTFVEAEERCVELREEGKTNPRPVRRDV